MEGMNVFLRKCTDNEIKQCLLEVLTYFDNLCKEYHLKYSLYAGSLLGAVRHKGFIPWDDDIDVMMPYPDFLKFIQIPEINDLSNRYILHYSTTEKMNQEKYVFPFPKLEDSRTQISFNSTKDQGGAFVDIFPLTGFPSGKKQVQLYTQNILRLRPKIPRATIIGKDPLRKIRNVYYRLNYKKYRDSYVELIKTNNYKDSKKVGQNVWPVNNGADIGEVFPKKWLESYTTLSFEGRSFKVISNYVALLELEYGNWEELPPESKRVATHDFSLYKKGKE